MAETPRISDLLDHAERLGDATTFAEQIHAFVGHSQFFADLSRDDVSELCEHMQVVRAGPRQLLIQEGTVVCGLLSRDDMLRIVADNPSLGAKILIKLVTMLSQRLRHTGAQLLQYMK